MRLPIFPVLGAFLSVAVFGPFVLMLAGPALTGDADAARVGLYLLLNVNPVAIPSLLVLLAVAWVCRRWAASPVPPEPRVTSAPRPLAHAGRFAIDPSLRRTTGQRGVVIDVVAVRADAGPVPGRLPRLPAIVDAGRARIEGVSVPRIGR